MRLSTCHRNEVAVDALEQVKGHPDGVTPKKIRGLPEVPTNCFSKDEHYDKLAEVVRQNLDMPGIYRIMSGKKGVK